MRKKLLLGLTLLFAATFASAQPFNISKQRLVKKSNKNKMEKVVAGAKTFKAKKAHDGWFNASGLQQKSNIATPFAHARRNAPRKADTDNQTNIWFCYPMSNWNYAIGFDKLVDWGFNSFLKGQTAYDVWSEIPYNYTNATVDSVCIIFNDVDKINSDSVYLYFMGSTDSIGTTYKEYSFPVSVLKDKTEDGYSQYTEFALPEKYTIPDGGAYVGYAFEAEEGASPILTFAPYDDDQNYDESLQGEGSFYFAFQYTDGNIYYQDFASYFGNLTTLVHMDINDCPKTNVSIGSIGEQTTLAGQATSIQAYVYNDASQTINSISYIVAIDGVDQTEATYTFSDGLAAGGYDAVTFATPSFEEGTHDVAVTVTKVDGQDNISKENVADDGLFIALEKSATRQSVVEEITSTSCGYCPRGAVGLAMLKEKGVITLANHFTYQWEDPMQVDDNIDLGNMIISYTGGLPGALFDRCAAGDPYFGLSSTGFAADQLSQAVASVIPSEGTVSLTADWADEAMTQIKVSTDVVFNYDRIGASYAIAYIISEDGMSGSGQTWLQYNYYSGNSGWASYDGMQKWVNLSTYATTTYDDVVVAVWGSAEGIDGTISNNMITKGETVNDSRSLSIASNSLIQDKGCLKLTALLINRNNGCIVNAAQVATRTFTGINSTKAYDSSVKEIARYNANGQRIDAPQKGLNIVKMSNGKSIKIMVKE